MNLVGKRYVSSMDWGNCRLIKKNKLRCEVLKQLEETYFFYKNSRDNVFNWKGCTAILCDISAGGSTL